MVQSSESIAQSIIDALGGPVTTGWPQSLEKSLQIIRDLIVQNVSLIGHQHSGSEVFVAASNANDFSKAKAGTSRTCDGVNDEVEIQAAIDFAETIGGHVAVSEGTFTIGLAAIVPKTGVTVVGMGDKTIITQKTNGNLSIFSTASSVTSFVVTNLKIDGNRANQNGGGVYDGISLPDAGTDCKVINCTIINCKGRGIYVGTSTGFHSIFNTISSCSAQGIRLGTNQVGTHNIENGQFVIALNRISSMYGEISPGIGIGIAHATNGNCIGNICTDCVHGGLAGDHATGSGIDLWNCHHSSITANTCNFNAFGMTPDGGTVAGSKNEGNAIDGNALNYNYHYGIDFANDNLNTRFGLGNTLIGNVDGTYRNTGTGVVIVGVETKTHNIRAAGFFPSQGFPPVLALRGSSANPYEKPAGWNMQVGAVDGVNTTWEIPVDWGGGAITVKWRIAKAAAGSGNIRSFTNWATIDGVQIDVAGTDIDATFAVPGTAEDESLVTVGTFTPSASAKEIRLDCRRWGGGTGDTYGDTLWFFGIELSYVSKRP